MFGDKRTKKFGDEKRKKLEICENNILPYYIQQNRKKFEDWLD